jgi:hypothetical protein
MSRINAFSRVLNQKVKTRFFYEFSIDGQPSGYIELEFFFSASSLKQQSAGRHIASIGHIILIPSQRSHVKVV